MGQSADEIASEFNLSLSAIYAGLAYYYDNREEIDSSIDSDQIFVQELKKRTPSLLRR
jgi:hypothetical protein